MNTPSSVSVQERASATYELLHEGENAVVSSRRAAETQCDLRAVAQGGKKIVLSSGRVVEMRCNLLSVSA